MGGGISKDLERYFLVSAGEEDSNAYKRKGGHGRPSTAETPGKKRRSKSPGGQSPPHGLYGERRRKRKMPQ